MAKTTHTLPKHNKNTQEKKKKKTLNPMKKVAFLWFGALSLTQKDLQEEEDGDG